MFLGAKRFDDEEARWVDDARAKDLMMKMREELTVSELAVDKA